jgi:predicted anti-sigma-YlaC factor YlaD
MHLTPESLAGYLDNNLPTETKREVELHLVSCTECREELTEVRRLQRDHRRPWGLVLVPAAAAAAVLLAIGLPRQAPAPSDTRTGSKAEAPLGIVSPVPTAEPGRGPITFRWRAAGLGASYTLTLQEADGRIVWTSTVTDTFAVSPESIAFSPGSTRFWFVDALLPDGRSRSTGIQRLKTQP